MWGTFNGTYIAPETERFETHRTIHVQDGFHTRPRELIDGIDSSEVDLAIMAERVTNEYGGQSEEYNAANVIVKSFKKFNIRLFALDAAFLRICRGWNADRYAVDREVIMRYLHQVRFPDRRMAMPGAPILSEIFMVDQYFGYYETVMQHIPSFQDWIWGMKRSRTQVEVKIEAQQRS